MGAAEPVAAAAEWPVALERIVRLLDQHGIARETVTLVLDKGPAALANPLEREQAGRGWITARRLSVDLAKPGARFTEAGIGRQLCRWLAGDFVADLVRHQLEPCGGHWRRQFEFNPAALERLLAHRLGRTVLLTNRIAGVYCEQAPS